MSVRNTAVVATAAALLAGCVTAPSPSEHRAPQPAKPVEISRLWSGRWHEVARLPDRLTDGCVAGASTYTPVSETRIDVRDTCQVGTPSGREKAIGGRGEILDPGTNAKLRVRYLAGLVTWDYWILDRPTTTAGSSRPIRPSNGCSSTPARFRPRRRSGP